MELHSMYNTFCSLKLNKNMPCLNSHYSCSEITKITRLQYFRSKSEIICCGAVKSVQSKLDNGCMHFFLNNAPKNY